MWRDDDQELWVLFGDPFPSLKCVATYEAWKDPQSWTHLDVQNRIPTRDGTDKIEPHRGAIAWNDYRKKWVSVFTQKFGSPSRLGEIWYAEADSPFGPWKDAIKVVTHNQYSFYNPQLHPEFTPLGSPILLFEGTYTKSFSATSEATPRHDYNQILYRLDLNEID